MKTQQTCHYLLYYHLVLTTKYRKQIIETYIDEIKQLVHEIATTSKFEVDQIESDRDHIHLLISARPDISPSQIVTRIKQGTTHELWARHEMELKKFYWKDQVFWNRGYFIASIGSVDKNVISRYITDQKHDSSVTLKGSQDSRADRN